MSLPYRNIRFHATAGNDGTPSSPSRGMGWLALPLAIALAWTSTSRGEGDAPRAAADGPPTRPAPAATSPLRYCNQQSIYVRYRWEGPDPVGVQMWIQLDGQSWLPWQWSAKPGEPILFTPPRQGRVTLALAPSPAETTAPPPTDCQKITVAFDWEKPLLRLTSARNLTVGTPILRLGWAAWDENLADRPISIYWRSAPDAPWQTGQTDLPNSGTYQWDIPADLAGKDAEVALRVTDLAGNMAETIVAIAVPSQPAATPTVETTTRPAQPAGSQPAASTAEPPPQPTRPGAKMVRLGAISLEADRLYELAQQSISRNNYEVAEDLLRQALDADPAFHQGRLQLAIVLQHRGQWQQAVSEYEAILATQPDNTTAWRNLALAYTTAKDYPKARVTLQKLLAVDSSSPQTWLDLGDVEMLSGRPETARQNWEKARSMSKPNTETYTKADKRLTTYVGK